jgi:nucleotide-binding universal stress UspA family protein
MQTILHPTDFSPRSEFAFRLACSLARDHGARLIVLYVLQPPVAAYGELVIDFEPGGFKEGAQEALHKLLSPDLQLSVETRVEEGDAATQIVRVAQDTGCDLIVMGTHGRTGLSRLLLGSVAEAVLRQAPCPVLTVKTPLKAPRLVAEAATAESVKD